MEYAMHGSLKEYLRTCRENVLSSGAPLRITNLEGEKDEDGSFLAGSLGEEDVCNFAYQIAGIASPWKIERKIYTSNVHSFLLFLLDMYALYIHQEHFGTSMTEQLILA